MLAAGTPSVTTDLATAELVKVAANSFLATKISYINAMAEVCEATGADVQDLAAALAYDDRIGGRFLQPGLGFGGGCLPKDIRAFVHRAEELGVGQSVAFLRQVDAINKRRRARTVDLVREQAGGVAGRCRGSAASVRRSSPTPTTSATPPRSTWPGCSRRRARSSRSTTPRRWTTPAVPTPTSHYADGVMEAAPGRRGRGPPDRVGPVPLHRPRTARRGRADGRSVVDGRHALDPDAWRAAGWTYRALGRAS